LDHLPSLLTTVSSDRVPSDGATVREGFAERPVREVGIAAFEAVGNMQPEARNS